MKIGKILILDKKIRRQDIPKKLGLLIAKKGIYKFYKNSIFEAFTKVLDEPNMNLCEHPYPTEEYFRIGKQIPYSILEEVVEHFSTSTNSKQVIENGKLAFENYKNFVRNLSNIDKTLLEDNKHMLLELKQEIEDFSTMSDNNLIEEIAYIIYDTKQDKYFVDTKTSVSKSGGHVNSDLTGKYNSTRFIIIGDIHFHHNMSAFFSGTDEADDKRFIGLHGVIGDFQDKKNYSLNIKFNMFKEAIRSIHANKVFIGIPNDVNPEYARSSNLYRRGYGGALTNWGRSAEQMYLSPKELNSIGCDNHDVDTYLSDEYIQWLCEDVEKDTPSI